MLFDLSSENNTAIYPQNINKYDFTTKLMEAV